MTDVRVLGGSSLICARGQAELTELAKKAGLPLVNVEPAMYMENFVTQMAVSPRFYFPRDG